MRCANAHRHLNSKQEVSPGQSPSTETPWKPQTLLLNYCNTTNHVLWVSVKWTLDRKLGGQDRHTHLHASSHTHAQTARNTNKCWHTRRAYLYLRKQKHLFSSVLIYSRYGSMGFTIVAITAEGLKDKHLRDNHCTGPGVGCESGLWKS